jgi:hypothetical protein
MHDKSLRKRPHASAFILHLLPCWMQTMATIAITHENIEAISPATTPDPRFLGVVVRAVPDVRPDIRSGIGKVSGHRVWQSGYRG